MTYAIPVWGLMLAAVLALGVAEVQAATGTLDTAKIEELTGLKGTYSKEENVFKVGKARSDIKVDVDGRGLPPFMGLSSWAAFTPAGKGQVMLMGDMVLFEDEVNPVMSVALDAGLEVTALHNHFFFDKPKVYFMHVGGMGSVDTVAAALKQVYDKIDEIRNAHAEPASTFPGSIAETNAITAAPLQAIFHAEGTADEGMFKVVLARHGARWHGIKLGKEMGVNSWAAFAGSDDQAVVDGDIVMTWNELQPVLKSLRASGINIMAIHQHMVGEQPQLLFLHYWGKGKAEELAQAVKKAISHTQLQ